MIEVILNDRVGKKIKVKCNSDDTIGDLKKLVALQIGTKPEKIVIKRQQYTILKDHITLEDYEISDGSGLELYYHTIKTSGGPSHGVSDKMSRKDDDVGDLKSYQARQGLQYVQEKPKFIQDFMQRAGMNPAQAARQARDQEPDYDDEVPMMVDSEGNVLTDSPAPTPSNPARSLEEDDGGDLAFLEASMKEFEHEALDPSEVPQQPSQKRGRTSVPGLQVRSSPKVVSNNARLLSFTMEEDEES